MGVDTYGKIKGEVLESDILNYIRQTIDPNAISDIKTMNYGKLKGKDFVKERYDNSEEWKITSGFIYFKSKAGNNRSLFYFRENINSYENLEFYEEYNLEDMVKARTTTINLGQNDEAVEIITNIVANFGGGWVDKNDCDNTPYEPVALNTDSSVIPVIHVTMNDVYEKFGGIVVIDDYHN